jgi:hypothetical protein
MSNLFSRNKKRREIDRALQTLKHAGRLDPATTEARLAPAASRIVSRPAGEIDQLS